MAEFEEILEDAETETQKYAVDSANTENTVPSSSGELQQAPTMETLNDNRDSNEESNTMESQNDSDEEERMCRDFMNRPSAKELGNKSFRKGEFQEAVNHWERDVRSCHLLLARDVYRDAPAKKAEIIELLTTVECNMAIGLIKLKRFEESLKFSRRVLKSDPDNVKALYRFACAAKELRLIDEAIAALERLLILEPENKAAILLLATTRKDSKNAAQLQKKMMQECLRRYTDPRVSEGTANSASPKYPGIVSTIQKIKEFAVQEFFEPLSILFTSVYTHLKLSCCKRRRQID